MGRPRDLQPSAALTGGACGWRVGDWANQVKGSRSAYTGPVVKLLEALILEELSVVNGPVPETPRSCAERDAERRPAWRWSRAFASVILDAALERLCYVRAGCELFEWTGGKSSLFARRFDRVAGAPAGAPAAALSATDAARFEVWTLYAERLDPRTMVCALRRAATPLQSR